MDRFSRTELLIGAEAIEKLQSSYVAIFGIGGVGGYVAEALARSGIGSFDLIDPDKVALSNINRQIIATKETIGKYKVDVMKERILSINPDAKVEVHKCFLLPEVKDTFDFGQYSYVVDAVDTVTAKIQIAVSADHAGVPVISSMGAGNKLNPTEFEVADLYETSVCPLAKVMRRELKRRNITHLKVVYSKEKPILPARELAQEAQEVEKQEDRSVRMQESTPTSSSRATPGSVAFVPSVVGLILASEVVKDLIKKEEENGQ